MSEPFSASYSPASIRELPFNSLKRIGEPVRPAEAMPLEPSAEQVRAVKGALNFLAALIAFYGELVEQDAHADAGPAGSKGADPQ
jgi:hypothetical protein